MEDDEEPVVDEDVPALCEADDGVLELLPAAVSVDGEVVVLPLVVAPEPVLGVAAVEPVLGVAVDPVLGVVAVEPVLLVGGLEPAPVALPEPEVPDCAQARPKVPAIAAAITVMPNLR